MTALEQLGQFVAEYRPDERTRVAVRLHVADVIGAWIAGAATAEGRALTAHRATAGEGIGDDIAARCACARLSEVDDIHLAAMVTPGAIVVPAALSLAAGRSDLAPDELVAAILGGYEAMVRFGVAIDGPSVLYRGIWPTYFAAPFGVAAVAARLLRLDATQTAHALATALIMAAPGTGHHAAPTTARWLAVGHNAGRGRHAALAARSGFTSDLGLAEGDLLKNIYGITPNVAALRDGFGEPALHRVSFKPWCAARQTMAATQALKEIIADGVAPDTIAEIDVAVLPPHFKMIAHGVTPGDRFSHLTSVPYNMAVAALAPDAAYQLSGPTGEIAPALLAFMAKIKVHADEALLQGGYPRIWPAHVTVTAASNRHVRRVEYVPGDPARPYGEAELKAKFVRLVGPVLGSRADAMFARALGALDKPSEAIGAIGGIEAPKPARR
jgi:2-methylcitrate dehydratase PrpD